MIVVSWCTRKPSIKLDIHNNCKNRLCERFMVPFMQKKQWLPSSEQMLKFKSFFPQVHIPLIFNMNMNNIQVEFFFAASKMRSPAKASRDAVRPTWDNFRMILPKKRLRYIETRHRQKLTQKHRHKTRHASPGASRRLVASEGGWALGFPVFQPCQELNENFF